MSAPRVTVVIPTLNPGADLPALLRALFSQRPGCPFEVLVIDSGSEPGQLAPLKAWPARRLDIPPGSFGHGRTRNRAVQASSAELIAFLTQDALPADDQWLKGLIDALDDHPRADGAYSRQLPRMGADAAIARRLSQAYPPLPSPQLRLISPDNWSSLSPHARLNLARYDHVSALARRQALVDRPLPDVPFGEDLAWAIGTLQAGRGIVYTPASRVIHSHKRSPRQTYERTRDEHQALTAWLGLRAVAGPAELLRGVAHIAASTALGILRGAPGSVALGEGSRLGAELLGQYIGARRSDRIDNLPTGR